MQSYDFILYAHMYLLWISIAEYCMNTLLFIKFLYLISDFFIFFLACIFELRIR
ncbi:hypothetical protein C2G38_2070313 [Gigaspora rosea]|uniref:Uncharacterized protein n=1 Tax=Gigaspora rosea TaxID=44941 RepID=A0A397VSJ9_9GLOM|nr:hypothetical protein C2G38_2070313 [Gigaspora rosea]